VRWLELAQWPALAMAMAKTLFLAILHGDILGNIKHGGELLQVVVEARMPLLLDLPGT